MPRGAPKKEEWEKKRYNVSAYMSLEEHEAYTKGFTKFAHEAQYRFDRPISHRDYICHLNAIYLRQ